ncbi:MAG TPA: ABC transporter substrate-binding protein [Thermoanaerobaculia bacterium]|nr:ABC transporter substrate-binding protein [Thermoanaerobaculia bacterium]
MFESAAAATSKVVRVGILSSIAKLDPREAVDAISGIVLSQVFEPPYSLGSGESKAQPLLFEPLRQESNLEYSAAMRPNIRFADGTPLTAEIAARSLRGSKVLTTKAQIEVRGDRIWFLLNAPNPRFDLTLTQGNCSIVLDRGTQLFGTGPYTFEGRPNLLLLQRAKAIRLVRNPHHAGAANADELEFRICPADGDGNPRLLVDALRTGEVDLTTSMTMADFSAHQLTGLAPSTQPGNSTAFLAFNCERRLLSTAAVRRAIALSLDLHELAAKSFDKNPAAFIAANLLPPLMGRSSGLPTSDRAEAKRLLDAAGVQTARLTLLVPWAPRPYMPKPQQLAQEVQRQLATLGLTVELRQTKSGEDFVNDLSRGNFDLALTGWIADTPDPADFFEALLWAADGHSNDSRYSSPIMDAALARFRQNPTEGNKREVHQLVRDEAPLVPLLYGQSLVLHSRKLRNVTVNATGDLMLSRVTLSM